MSLSKNLLHRLPFTKQLPITSSCLLTLSFRHFSSSLTSHSSSIPSTMKSLLLTGYGQPTSVLKLEKQPVPEINANQMLIRVHTVACNPLDSMQTLGYAKTLLQYTQPLPTILGRDCVGEIVQVGENIWDYSAGEMVMCSIDPLKSGCFAEYVAVSKNEITRKPEQLSSVQAACLPFATTTAWQGLVSVAGVQLPNYKPSSCEFTSSFSLPFKLPLPILSSSTPSVPLQNACSSKQVVIHGASGVVGLVSYHMLKQAGYTVHLTCKSEDVDWLESVVDNNNEKVYNGETINWQSIFSKQSLSLFLDLVGTSNLEEIIFPLIAKSGYFLTTRGEIVKKVDEKGIVEGLVER